MSHSLIFERNPIQPKPLTNEVLSTDIAYYKI